MSGGIPFDPFDSKKPKPSKEEFTIQRLRKQLKRTQARAERLMLEAGERFLKSRAAHYMDLWRAEKTAHAKTASKLSDTQRELKEAKLKNGAITLDVLWRLVEEAKAAKKP